MTNQKSKFTLRIDSDLMKKVHSVAKYNARSANGEIEIIIRKHIKEFEKKNGTIDI